MNVIVCSHPYVRTVAWCCTCQSRRRMAGTFGIYYGAYLICLSCGDSYDDDYCGTAHTIRDPRPFRRNWKREQIEAAGRMWANAAPLKAEMQRQLLEMRR